MKIHFGRADRTWHDGRVVDGMREPRCKTEFAIAINRDAAMHALQRLDLWWCADCGRPAQSYNTPPNYFIGWQKQRNIGAQVWAWMTHDEYAPNSHPARITRHRLLDDPLDDWRRYYTREEYEHAGVDPVSGWRSRMLPWVRIAHDLGIAQPYLEVDHIIPLIEAEAAGLSIKERFGIGNLQALCARHHKAKTAREAAARARARPREGRPDQEMLFA